MKRCLPRSSRAAVAERIPWLVTPPARGLRDARRCSKAQAEEQDHASILRSLLIAPAGPVPNLSGPSLTSTHPMS